MLEKQVLREIAQGVKEVLRRIDEERAKKPEERTTVEQAMGEVFMGVGWAQRSKGEDLRGESVAFLIFLALCQNREAVEDWADQVLA